MKSCPICHAAAFNDAKVCYGCLHRFEEGEDRLPADAEGVRTGQGSCFAHAPTEDLAAAAFSASSAEGAVSPDAPLGAGGVFAASGAHDGAGAPDAAGAPQPAGAPDAAGAPQPASMPDAASSPEAADVPFEPDEGISGWIPKPGPDAQAAWEGSSRAAADSGGMPGCALPLGQSGTTRTMRAGSAARPGAEAPADPGSLCMRRMVTDVRSGQVAASGPSSMPGGVCVDGAWRDGANASDGADPARGREAAAFIAAGQSLVVPAGACLVKIEVYNSAPGAHVLPQRSASALPELAGAAHAGLPVARPSSERAKPVRPASSRPASVQPACVRSLRATEASGGQRVSRSTLRRRARAARARSAPQSAVTA